MNLLTEKTSMQAGYKQKLRGQLSPIKLMLLDLRYRMQQPWGMDPRIPVSNTDLDLHPRPTWIYSKTHHLETNRVATIGQFSYFVDLVTIFLCDHILISALTASSKLSFDGWPFEVDVL